MLCQRCGKANQADREKCRSCGAPLYVVGADRGTEPSAMQPFLGVEDYLIDKLSTVEKQASRHSEDVDLLVHAVEFMERNVMVNRAGILVLANMLRERGLIVSSDFDRRWREKTLSNLAALNRKERFLDARPDILAAFKGSKNRRRFEERLARAEAMTSRCFWPPESEPVARGPKRESPTRSSASPTLALISSKSTPRWTSAKETSSSTVRLMICESGSSNTLVTSAPGLWPSAASRAGWLAAEATAVDAQPRLPPWCAAEPGPAP